MSLTTKISLSLLPTLRLCKNDSRSTLHPLRCICFLCSVECSQRGYIHYDGTTQARGGGFCLFLATQKLKNSHCEGVASDRGCWWRWKANNQQSTIVDEQRKSVGGSGSWCAQCDQNQKGGLSTSEEGQT